MALTCDSGMMLWGEIRCCQRVKLVLNCSPNVERKLFGITSYELLRKKLFCVLDHDYKLWCVLPPSECSFWATENLLQFRQNSGSKIVLSTLRRVKEWQKVKFRKMFPTLEIKFVGLCLMHLVFCQIRNVLLFTILHPVNASESLEWTILLTKRFGLINWVDNIDWPS